MAGGSVKLSIFSKFDDAGVKKADRELKKFTKAYGKINKDTGMLEVSKASSALKEQAVQLDATAARWRSYSKELEAAGMALTKHVSAPAAAAIASSTKLAVDYEDSFAKVKTIMDKTAEAPEALSAQILQLSTATGKSATELSEATYQALSASVETSKVSGFVEDSVKLAKVGFTDTATAVDTLTTIINAYGMSASDAAAISDKLVQTQNKGKTTVAELASSMGNVIPTAAAYGVNLDNLATAYVQMTKQGINTANATTAINGMLTELADNGSNVAKIISDRTGKSFGQLMADGYSLGDVLGMLNESVGGNSEEFANLWGNVRASKGALAIANAGVEGFNSELAAMQGASGNVSSALADLDTSSAKANRAINAIKNTGIELGQEFLGAVSPALQAAADAAQGLYTAFASMGDGQKQAIAGALAFAAASGPMVLGLSKAAAGVSGLYTMLGKASDGLAVLTASGVVSEKTAARMSSAIGRASGALGALTSGPALAGMAALAVAVAACAKGIYDTKVRIDQMKGATSGLDEAVNAFAPDLGKATADMTAFGKASGRTKADVESVTRAQAELAESIAERNKSAQAEINQLESARAVIEKYMNQTDLTAQQQGQLKAAVEQVNEACGTQYQVVDAASGKIADETGAVLENTDAIRENIAQKQALIKTEALQENLKGLYEQQATDIAAVASATSDLKAAQADLAEAEAAGVAGERWQEAADAVRDAEQALGEAKGDLESVNSAIAATETQLGNTQAAAEGAELTLGQLASTRVEIQQIIPPDQLEAFCGQLDQTGISIEQFSGLTQAQMMDLAMSYDGSAASIIAAAQRIGIEVPEGMDATAEAAAAGESTGQAYADGLGDAEGPTRDAASGISSATSGMKVSGTWQWGYDAGANFASGLRAAGSAVSSAASGIAAIAASILEHSVPKRGPMHNRGKGETEWGMHAIENFAAGMNRGVRLVEMASGAAAQAAADGLQPRGTSSARTGGGELRISPADMRMLAGAIGREMRIAGVGSTVTNQINVDYKDGSDINEIVRDIGFALRTSAMMEG